MLDLLFSKGGVKRRAQPVASERPLRSLAKAISWRVTGSLDTMLLSWFFTGDLTVAAAIGLTEVLTKMFLYYLHERIWNRISLGKIQEDGGWQETGTVAGLESGLSPAARTSE